MLKKINFYSTLNLLYLNFLKGEFITPKKTIPLNKLPLTIPKSIHFLVPLHQNEAGAKIIIYDIIPELVSVIKKLKLPWSITISPEEPTYKIDVLICFKCIPKLLIKSNQKKILLICDQAELFWNNINEFDYAIATSSEPFANLISKKNKKTFFISESETIKNLNVGTKNLVKKPSERDPILLWHGGAYSIQPLLELRPLLEDFAKKNDFQLTIISGKSNEKRYKWGKIEVRQIPWSQETFISEVSKARLGIIPAKEGLRSSYLKPASRIRALYALGTPAIGDFNVPDVRKFMGLFNGPMAHSKDDWLSNLAKLWNDKEIDNLANKGWLAVNQNYSAKQTAFQWVNFLLQIK